jgi:hypothetical protein
MRKTAVVGALALVVGLAWTYGDGAATNRTRTEVAPYGQSGCCSHHKGKCGCSGGYVLCCDGTISPTCTC